MIPAEQSWDRFRVFAERDDCERSEMRAIEERDALSDAITETHAALGGDGVWIAKPGSTLPAGDTGDLAVDVPALARRVIAERDALRDAASRHRSDTDRNLPP